MRLYFRNVDYGTSERELRDLFAPYGGNDLLLCLDKLGNSRGFGFVNCLDGESAITDLQGKDVGGRPLQVEPARPKRDRAA